MHSRLELCGMHRDLANAGLRLDLTGQCNKQRDQINVSLKCSVKLDGMPRIHYRAGPITG